MTSPTRLCKDCRWCKRDWLMAILSLGVTSPLEYSKCLSPKAYGNQGSPSDTKTLVGYRPKTLAAYCETERGSYGPLQTCGPEGAFWGSRS